MRDYGKVYSRFWASRDMRALSEDARYLALYLMTCKHCTLAGIFHLPDGYVCDDIQWTPERVSKGFAELSRKGFATRCDDTRWVWITKHLEWNGLQNPNQAKSAAKILDEVPADCCWLADFEKVLDDFIRARCKWLRKGSETVAETHTRAARTVSEPSANGSPTVSHPVSVSVSESVSETVTVPVTVTVGFADSGEPPAEGCVPRGGDDSKLNGANGHAPEPAAFTTLRALYPDRAGDHRWSDALTSYTSNLAAGHSHELMLDGVMRYARFCQAEGITGTKYVKAAATFLGPNRGYLEPWKPSEKPKRETVGERWLREQEANDASH